MSIERSQVIEDNGRYRVWMTLVVGNNLVEDYVTYTGVDIIQAMHQWLGVPCPEPIPEE